MSLLRDIQKSIVSEGAALSPNLLKLRLLASMLGVEILEEWVKFEIEGYPPNSEIPLYRKVPISYSGTFSGPFGRRIENAPIPNYLIAKHAGENWNQYAIRQSMAGIDELLSHDENSSLQINASNLILIMQGIVYKDYACNSISGSLSKASLVEIQNVVRNRMLELTIQIEKTTPNATEYEVGHMSKNSNTSIDRELAQNVSQVIYGSVTQINNSGSHAKIKLNIGQKNIIDFKSHLISAGFPKEDVEELASILESEKPEEAGSSFGKKAKDWLATNLKKAVNGTWKMGMTVATALLEEAAKQYYGLN